MIKNIIQPSLVFTFVLLAFGILLIFESEATIISLSYIIGGILIAVGILALIKFATAKEKQFSSDLDIIYGIVTIVLGILVITNPRAIASIIPFVIGVGILISGGSKLLSAMQLKHSGIAIWKSTMIMAILSTLCGVVLIFNPFGGAVLIARIIGIVIVIFALLDLISTLKIRKVMDKVEKSSRTIEDSVIDVEAKVKDKE